MSQLNEAIARYHKILESEPYRDLFWVKDLQEQMESSQLSSGGRLLCPFLRPNFVTQRQYDALVKAGESLLAANARMQALALRSPRLLSQLELLPAEKMLAAIDPGYSTAEVSSKLDLQFSNGNMQVTQYTGGSPSGIAYSENLAHLFYDSPPMKEFRRKYTLTHVGGKKPFLTALLDAYRHFSKPSILPNAHASNGHAGNGNGNGHNGAHRVSGNGNGSLGLPKPRIAFIEFRQSAVPSELALLRDFFRKEGLQAEILSPEQLQYKDGKLRSGSFEIDLVYRRFRVQEFLVRFDLSHPLMRAYRDGKVCVVNSFRSEMSHKRAMVALLTDDALVADFPAAERKAIREHVPWTRVVKPGKTSHSSGDIDLLAFIRDHRGTLILKPNDESVDEPEFNGQDLDEAAWEKALRHAQRTPYVVQERVTPTRLLFPLMSYGHLEFREMNVGVYPQAFLGKVAGCSSWLSATGNAGFSSSAGIAPTFIIDAKS